MILTDDEWTWLIIGSGTFPDLRRSQVQVWLPNSHPLWRTCDNIRHLYEVPLQTRRVSADFDATPL